MPKLRYLQGPSDGATSGALRNTVSGIRASYETDRAVAEALLPKPLELTQRPEIWLQMVHVAMHKSETETVEIGALTTGVMCTYEGKLGAYCFHMAMEGESVVTSGRERFGEPKKIAETHFERNGDHIRATCIRHGITYFEIEGTIGEKTDDPLQFVEHLYCYKGLPSIDTPGEFNGDVFLTQLNWERNYTERRAMEGKITLRESPFDPLVDVPVRRLLGMQYVEGGTATSGELLRTVPGEWIAPHWVGRMDEPHNQGISVGRQEAA